MRRLGLQWVLFWSSLFVGLVLLIALWWGASGYTVRRIPNVKETVEGRKWREKYPGYGYNGTIYQLRAQEFPHLNGDRVYLDYAGMGVYQHSQLRAALMDLEDNFRCNIHSASACSRKAEEAVDAVRDQILNFFNAPRGTYTVIFTSGATASLRLAADSFPWSEGSHFLYAKHNHNSVLGMRRLAMERGATFNTLPFELYKTDLESTLQRSCNTSYLQLAQRDEDGNVRLPTARDLVFNKKWGEASARKKLYHLVAFPAEDNFAGIKYNLDLIHAFQSGDFGEQFLPESQRNAGGCSPDDQMWHVLLDAAGYVPKNPLDLSRYPASFVVMSFYKMFGYPTGLGALLVRNDLAPLMRKVFFAGGSVVMAGCDSDYCKLKPQYHERFEDGTLDIAGITALKVGFETLERIGMENIQRHVWTVVRRAYEGLSRLQHSNGSPLVKIYGEHAANDPSIQGGTLAFNLLSPTGSYVGYSDFSKLAARHGFMLRAGCNCNPGACHNYIGIPESMIIQASEKRTSCGDEMDQVDGIPLGANRLSFGYASTIEDVDRFVEFVERFYRDRGTETILLD